MSFVVSVNTANPPPKFKKLTDVESSPSLPLPDEIIVMCFAYTPRCYYPSLSLVNRTFRRLVSSTELNVVRSLLQQTENVLYIALRFSHEEDPIWYTLNQKPYKNESNFSNHRLVPFPSFPSFPSLPCWGSSVIVIGQEIYVFGGCINGELTSNVFVINCMLNTCLFLPSMRVPRGCAAFGVVDSKIYIIGGCNKTDSLNNWVEVFNLKKQIWECFSSVCNEEIYKITLKSVVMDEKIYILDRTGSFVYDPKKGTWERELILNSDWKVGSCVIDNKLYSFAFDYQKRYHRLSVYDPKVRIWSFVKGVEDLPKMYDTKTSRMANHGGKLAIFIIRGKKETTIWCTEIALEMRGQQREIWGKVLWFSLVLKPKISPRIVQCLNVTI